MNRKDVFFILILFVGLLSIKILDFDIVDNDLSENKELENITLDYSSLTLEDFEAGYTEYNGDEFKDLLGIEVKEVRENTKRQDTGEFMGITYEFIFSNFLDDEMDFFVKVFIDEEVDKNLFISSNTIGTESGAIVIPVDKRYIMNAEYLLKDYKDMTVEEKYIYDEKIGDFSIIIGIENESYYFKVDNYKIINID